jgi:predicted NUDIX family NTP pyrophosphohydrolase
MTRRSAGLVLHRVGAGGIEVLLVHPGGPYWRGKDLAAWSIPKGEYGEGEDPLDAAEREFCEELGRPAPPGARRDLGEVRQASGKRVRAWAVAADFDCTSFSSNLAEVEWPARSGKYVQFPEIDQAAWFSVEDARTRLVRAQVELLERMLESAAPIA